MSTTTETRHTNSLPEPTNYGFAGMAICLPQVVDNIARIVGDCTGKEDGLDATMREVWFSTHDLTANLLELGKILRYDKDTRRVHVKASNHSTYKDFAGIKAVVQSSIETLMNYAVVIGQDTLLLLENMWAYLHLLSKEEPDEFAYEVVRTFGKSVKESMR